MASLSVLICSYNRPLLLTKALEGLLRKSTELPDEVILVNGGGEDTDRAAQSFLDMGSRLRVIKTRNISLACSQNIGLRECRGELIALTDDDAVVVPEWVSMIKRVMAEHPEASAVGGPVISLDPTNRISRLAHYTTFPEPMSGTYVRTIAGVNICYRREAVKSVGDLDEALVSSEEVDYNWRLVRSGGKIWWDPRIRVFHHDRRDLRSYLSQQFYYGRGYYQTRHKWPDLYSQYPRGLRTGKDFLKALYFFPGMFLESLRAMRKTLQLGDWILFPSLIFLAGAAHRLGFLYELRQRALRER